LAHMQFSTQNLYVVYGNTDDAKEIDEPSALTSARLGIL
jgi:hypothetical protein